MTDLNKIFRNVFTNTNYVQIYNDLQILKWDITKKESTFLDKQQSNYYIQKRFEWFVWGGINEIYQINTIWYEFWSRIFHLYLHILIKLRLNLLRLYEVFEHTSLRTTTLSIQHIERFELIFERIIVWNYLSVIIASLFWDWRKK